MEGAFVEYREKRDVDDIDDALYEEVLRTDESELNNDCDRFRHWKLESSLDALSFFLKIFYLFNLTSMKEKIVICQELVLWRCATICD